jgi:hypothetical protein
MQDLFITGIQVFVNNNLYLEDKTRFELNPEGAGLSVDGTDGQISRDCCFRTGRRDPHQIQAYSYPSSVR